MAVLKRHWMRALHHRHLNHQGYTLAAIDDVIARGRLRDWIDLRDVALGDRVILEKIMRVAGSRASDLYAQRYRFWKSYAERHLA